MSKIEKGYYPINKSAVKVVFGENIQFIPKRTSTNIYKIKPPCLSEKDIQQKAINTGHKIGTRKSNEFIEIMCSLVGKQFGRLTVVGLAKTTNSNARTYKPRKNYVKFIQKYKTFKDAFISNHAFDKENFFKDTARIRNNGKGRLQVCRCVCGNFCKFRKKSLEKGTVTRCDECRYLEVVVRLCKKEERKKRKKAIIARR
tara:strand:- start:44 stop:643 length:600 start_codon:yes stop_codon:yes gene_type:complete